MYLEPVQYGLGALSGGLVGFTLGLFGGGGSILAVPLMVYVVGVPNPHLAIGTSAFAVAANAFANLLGHARRRRAQTRRQKGRPQYSVCSSSFCRCGIHALQGLWTIPRLR